MSVRFLVSQGAPEARVRGTLTGHRRTYVRVHVKARGRLPHRARRRAPRPAGDLVAGRAHVVDRPGPSGRAGPSRRSACRGCTGTRRRSPSSRRRRRCSASSCVSRCGRRSDRSMPELAHHLDDLAGARARPGRRSLPADSARVPAGGGPLEQRAAHLRAPGVVQADEQDVRHQAASPGGGSARG